MEYLSPEQIEALARFYRTDEGRILLEKGLTPATLQDSIAFLKDGPGAPMWQNWPELDAHMALDPAEVTEQLTELMSLDRIADLMEMESVVAFEDESRRDAVVEALRAFE